MSIAQNWLAGINTGRQHRMQDEAIAKQNRLGQLAGQAFGAAPEQRGGILSQVAEVDPESAFAMQDRFSREDQSAEQAKHARLTNMAKMLAAAPEPMRGGLYSQMVPSLRGMGLQAPDAWDDSLMGVVQSLVGGGDTTENLTPSMRSLIWQRDNNVINGDEFSQAVRILNRQEAAMQNQQFSPQRMEQADGSFRIDLVPTRGGNVVGGSPAPAPRPAGGTGAPNMDAILAQANILARQGVPDAQIEQFITRNAQQQGVQVTPAGMDAAANRTLDAQTYGTSPAVAAPGGQATNATRAAAAAEAAAMKRRAELQVERESDAIGGLGKANMRMEMADSQYASITDAISDAMDLVRPTTTGFIGARARNIEGTGSFDLAKAIVTVQANLGFDRLQEMRDASPTGGALGQVAVQELEGLQATVASLDPNQSEAQVRAALKKVQGHYDRWYETTRRALQRQQESGERARNPAGTTRLRFNPETGELE